MNTEPKITPPKDYEILTPDTLRKYGAVEGMKYWDPKTERWHEAKRPNFREGIPLAIDDYEYVWCAPLGTTAMLSTPLPEVRCLGQKFCNGFSDYDHHPDCPAHPRNRRVKVLPEWLAKCETKPEGLEWLYTQSAVRSWHKWRDILWPDKDAQIWKRSDYAYSVPFHVWEKVEGERKQSPVLAHDERSQSGQLAGEVGSIPSGTPSDLARTEGPTDGEMWLKRLEMMAHRAGYAIRGERLIACVDAALTSAMQKEGK